MRKLTWMAALGLASLAGNAIAGDHSDHGNHGTARFDYGVFLQRQLNAFSGFLFGVRGPVKASSTESLDQATAEAHPTGLVTVAKSLRVHTVSANPNLGAETDMIAFWPNGRSPTHLITCNEGSETDPAVQRVRLPMGTSGPS